jgi:hypothetical protein
MNFFDRACQEPPINHTVFGVCDDQKGGKAYTNTDEPGKWVATVKNAEGKTLVFTAVDACVIKGHEEAGRGRCDGLLTSPDHIFFIELKDEAKGWIPGAIEQLESTVQFFIANHDLRGFKHKKAFACNKKHRHFQETDNEFNLHFFRTYGVRIDIQAEIIVI